MVSVRGCLILSCHLLNIFLVVLITCNVLDYIHSEVPEECFSNACWQSPVRSICVGSESSWIVTLFWWNWVSFSVLDPLRRCWQIPRAIPNHYLGVWWVAFLKYLIKAKQYCSQQQPYEKVFLNIPEIQPWFPPKTEEIFRDITLNSHISARPFGWSLCPTKLKYVKPHKDLLPPTTAQSTNKVHTYSLEL